MKKPKYLLIKDGKEQLFDEEWKATYGADYKDKYELYEIDDDGNRIREGRMEWDELGTAELYCVGVEWEELRK